MGPGSSITSRIPSGNITGMSLMVPELAVKRLELLRELVPGISRVLVLSYLADPIAPLQVNAMEGAAGSIGITLQVGTFEPSMTSLPLSKPEPERAQRGFL